MMSKLFKDYLPYLVDDQSDQVKRYPTRALNWKRFKDEKPKKDGYYYVKLKGEEIIRLFFWDSRFGFDSYDVISYIDTEVYDSAKAREDMWLPLGEGWKYDKIDDFYWKNEEGTSIRIDVSPRYIHINYFQGVCKIPCEICTLEIVQKLIEQINDHSTGN